MADGASPKSERPTRFYIQILEIMVGFSVACMLTLAFMGNLRFAGKLSLCAFALALPVLIALRIDTGHLVLGEPSVFRQFTFAVEVWAHVLAVVGFCALLWEVFWVASVILATMIAVILVLVVVNA